MAGVRHPVEPVSHFNKHRYVSHAADHPLLLLWAGDFVEFLWLCHLGQPGVLVTAEPWLGSSAWRTTPECDKGWTGSHRE